jgi:ankyrin repeat protein
MRACAYNKKVEVTKVLLENGADIDEKDEGGKTALMHAIFFVNKPAVVRLLLENGANVNAKDKYGRTALMMASNRPKRFRQLLINYGAKE